LTAVLVLDVSGSMEGAPIAHVIRSAERLAEILSDEDSLGGVAFADESRTISPIRALNEQSRAEIKREGTALKANGGTNKGTGLSRAALLFPARFKDERQIALVLTDGQPNQGVHTKEGLCREVELVKTREIAVSTLGFGRSHNEDLLVALADAGGGRYAFVN